MTTDGLTANAGAVPRSDKGPHSSRNQGPQSGPDAKEAAAGSDPGRPQGICRKSDADSGTDRSVGGWR